MKDLIKFSSFTTLGRCMNILREKEERGGSNHLPYGWLTGVWRYR